MKKTLALALCLLMALTALCLAETSEVDAVTSASTVHYFGGIEGDELMDAINSYTGFYAVASVNPDGTPNIAFFIYGMVKIGDDYFVQLGLSPNQTTLNIENGSKLMAMYGKTPEEYPYASIGARMSLEKVEDEETLSALSVYSPNGFTPLYYKVTSVVPMG